MKKILNTTNNLGAYQTKGWKIKEYETFLDVYKATDAGDAKKIDFIKTLKLAGFRTVIIAWKTE